MPNRGGGGGSGGGLAKDHTFSGFFCAPFPKLVSSNFTKTRFHKIGVKNGFGDMSHVDLDWR